MQKLVCKFLVKQRCFLGYLLFVLFIVPSLIKLDSSFQIFKFDMFSHSGSVYFYDFLDDGEKSFLIRNYLLKDRKGGAHILRLISSGEKNLLLNFSEFNRRDLASLRAIKVSGENILGHFFVNYATLLI